MKWEQEHLTRNCACLRLIASVLPRSPTLLMWLFTKKKLKLTVCIDFLGGLDPQFDSVRGRILAMTPVPSVLEAYALVVEEDTRLSSQNLFF
ncbi:hypothetical protein L3X38_045106 [Prunus dulcis]|uniref:Uncharacterized protein n=1 Tax=Prunus dulcis TaxID=3755 RepID=A0AAD4UZR4_PRUDU|nr:hypothetical protein L3X38_045106 [Prunus dulcis]